MPPAPDPRPRSYVVTGGTRGVGRAVTAALLGEANTVVVIDLAPAADPWHDDPALQSAAERDRLVAVTGDAGHEDVANLAADRAEAAAPLAGWVNNAALFRDAWLHEAPATEVMRLIDTNLAPTVVGCATAVRRFLAAGRGGAVVNVSSHQAQRAVRGALPYATAKAAVEGLTRALAVDHGPDGVRVNAVSLGSIRTERSDAHLAGLLQQGPDAVARFEDGIRRMHPLGRMGTAAEVAAVVAFLLSEAASFVTGAIVPVDGGRSALGRDPEEA